MTSQLVALAANGLLALVLLAVGCRLLWLARRTRQLPELILGISSCAASGAIWVPLGHLMIEGAPVSSGVWAVVSRALLAVSISAIALLAWRVFRPETRWAGALFGLLSLGPLARVFYDLQIAPGVTPSQEAFWWTTRLSIVLTYVWAAMEAYLYQSALRRRQRFGLAAESRVPTRVLLWSLALGLSAVLYAWLAAVAVARSYYQIHLPDPILTSGLGLVVSLCLWLAFFPPGGRPRSDGGSSQS